MYLFKGSLFAFYTPGIAYSRNKSLISLGSIIHIINVSYEKYYPGVCIKIIYHFFLHNVFISHIKEGS